MSREYVRDGAAIYAQSFATIRQEADLARFPPDLEPVVVRMIHACGMVDLPADVAYRADLVAAARGALTNGAPIFCDAQMVASGITRARLPADNTIICTLTDPSVPQRARELATTRSAAALDLWLDRIEGSVVAFGNAPTALFRLLELLDAGAAKPAAIIGLPVGFVGAAESKVALAAADHAIPYLVVHGRRGGSAMCVAAINALAAEKE
jgi:precorrin-8X/cobalt-precorrin-8 methylmutase